MKNLLITLMVLLIVVAAGTALAGDAVKVYGKLHTSLNYVNNGDQSGFTLTSNTSRFGVKGGIELNENITAIYQFESYLNMAQKDVQSATNDTKSTLASRNTFLGIKGKFGTFLAGIHDTPFKTLGRKVTFFKDEIGDFRTTTLGYDKRLQDVIVYVTPKSDAWGGQLAYQLDQNDWANELAASKTAFSGMVYVTPGSFFIGVAYETWSKGYFVDLDADDSAKSTGAFRVAANYDASKWGFSGLFQSVSNLYGSEDSATTFGLEALFRAAEKWHIKGNYYTASISPDVGDSDSFGQFALGVDHVFAPSTKFYLQMAMVSNGDFTDVGLGGYDDGDVNWGNGWGDHVDPAMKDDGGYENPMGFSLGVVHKF